MAQVVFPLTIYSGPSGAISNGTVQIRINVDSQSPGGLICANIPTIVSLDADGAFIGTPVFWPNGDLLPDGTYYIVVAFSSVGELVCGPFKVTI